MLELESEIWRAFLGALHNLFHVVVDAVQDCALVYHQHRKLLEDCSQPVWVRREGERRERSQRIEVDSARG